MANEAIEHKIDSLIELVKKNNPDADTELILKAYHLADGAHKDQKRLSGEAYIIHPVSVAYILAEYKMDTETIVAAILHDVIEDTSYTYDDIKEMFNEQVADLVEGVTKIGKIEYQSKEESQAENLRKMVLAMSKDIRVILIKLVDRLHNMRTLEYMKESKQIEKSRETLDIYAPIANRLGIQTIKAELEDLALKYLDPDGYYDLVKKVKMKKQSREEYINKVIKILEKKIDEVGIEAKIYGRSKHFYSIYRKMKAQNRNFDEIYDLIAVRVIVDSVKDCYGVLGIVHTQWKPIPGRFKDYIAMPKPNMYQSIHTTVIGPNGDPFEIQIRTKEMHETAEYGIAAHWKYKEGITDSNNKELRYENKMSWLRQILEWQKELDNANDLVETIKVDLLNEEVYVFTPQGKVVELPMGSCPLDFAYRIHSDVGNSCVGAKVNGKIVPLNYTLNNGDFVEIMTSKNSNGPSRDWLNFTKSAHARNKIRQYFKKEEKEENIAKGKTMLEREIKREGLQDTKLLSTSELEVVSDKMGYKTLSDFYAAIGYSGVKIGTVLQKMRLLFPKEFPEPEEEVVIKKTAKLKKSNSSVIVAGHNEIDVRFSKCCNPVPGDKIVGYITVGRGISVHRTDCPNVLGMTDPSRIVDVEWNKFGIGGSFTAEIQIKAREKQGLLIEISKIFLEMNIPLTALTARNEKGEFDYFSATFEVKTRRELNLLIKNLNKIPEIISIHRV
ncbi:RelA/SpoT family protein [Eubacterium callanderi]|uniref:RelA/SpoT family protein n=1 Tax=Eubacterium callanderi TaxID=53442 RepID=UPI001EDFB7D8|nr:bifunctional (p)ppGpp synthetase/guanosine-3',5'-bis(diphosphate) 3'-pyrophosphohydrolase [Eubacterium callanderi]MCG4589003.1 bifunctional (p)ppGpp synthetase/guanosine-3',5'-bis(diphosphate) 3'-pyrophosphohydrolase [Eubacterium callanderi]MCQ4821572.1 bifunctional (p)ppGpp synthetase/guanosine-3',5'-bis(diphosphate) 3'-pyrophosphohydrolase [Eubacterium callanderi]MCQ4824762.1 bifunctional (p)ppGpp synthetase/guanosine-3',5'-bis(diphosphate) 3'-pyrophosphohydrolase [Eubacterium callanderi]